jgi:AraC family transcriptional regulator, arabinose operon regulatory protein
MKIRVLSLETDNSLPQNDSIDKPKGGQCYSLYFFKSSGLIKTSIGLSDFRTGDCILLDPTFPIYVKCKQSSIDYDIISFKGSDATRLVQQVGLELNTLHTPIQTFFIDSILDRITKESRASDLLWERIVAGCVDELLSKIYRFSKQDFVLSMPDHAQKLRDLRSEVHETFSKPWTIGQMASKMKLSPSRFASLYKKEFNTSPTEDLIRTRIDQAKRMLSTTKVSVKQVSLACGFESVHYFHRAFKKRNNITPKHFQNHKLSMKGSIPSKEKTFTLDGLSLEADFVGTIEINNGEIFLNGTDQQWNDFLGYDAELINNKPFFNFVSPTHLEIAKEAMNNIVDGKNVQDIAIDLISKSGDIVNIEFSALVKGKAWFWFARNVSVMA